MKTKKILALIMALTLALFVFSACQSSKGGSESSDASAAADEEAPSAVYNTRTGIVLNILVQDGDEVSAAAGRAVSSILTDLGYTSEVIISEDVYASGEEGKEALALITNDLAAGFKLADYLALAKLAPNCILVASNELVSDEIAFDVLTGISDNIEKIISSHEDTSGFKIDGAKKDVIIKLHPGAESYYDSLGKAQ